MKDVLLTSSVLIGALLILRLLFRRVIARRVQYALWLLVAVRLLVPVSLPAADFSVLTAAEPVSRQITAPSLYMEPVQEDVEGPADLPALDKTLSDYSQVAIGGATKDNTRVFTDEKNVTHTVEYARQIHLTDILAPAWYAGIAVMLFWMLMEIRFFSCTRFCSSSMPALKLSRYEDNALYASSSKIKLRLPIATFTVFFIFYVFMV